MRNSMVPGRTEISLNSYNSRNICNREERFLVLESPSHARSDDIFVSLKLENLVYHVFVTSSNMTSQYDILTFSTLEIIKTRIQGSVQSLVRKCSESANLPYMTDFKVIWSRCDLCPRMKGTQRWLNK